MDSGSVAVSKLTGCGAAFAGGFSFRGRFGRLAQDERDALPLVERELGSHAVAVETSSCHSSARIAIGTK